MKHVNQGKCSNTELKMLGDFWTLAIVQALDDSEKRFSELQRELTKASPTTLTNRLKKLEEQKIVKRKEETVDKLSVAYSLTDKGRGILPILHEIHIFADQFLK
ncbi:MAG: helix-turn-helix domain-containing protein [bacterium]|nr:helix-turn-helix domain-containing protein [bacterium]